MHDIASLRARIVDVVKDVYDRPHMYGPLAENADDLLGILRWVLAEIDGSQNAHWDAYVEIAGAARRQAGSFANAYHVEAGHGYSQPDKEGVEYVTSLWHEVSKRLGICD